MCDVAPNIDVKAHGGRQGHREFPFGNSRESATPKIPSGNSRELLSSR